MNEATRSSRGRRFGPTRILPTLALVTIACYMAVAPARALTPPPTTAATPTTGKMPDVRVPGLKSSDFQDPSVCLGCHPDISNEWQNSMHRNYENPAFTWANREADKATKGATKEFCVACHTPIGALTGETAEISGSGLSKLAKKGISCDLCHTIDKVNPDWPGNASFHVAPGPVKRAQLKDAVSPEHKTAYSKLHTEADFCGMCHNFSHPLSGVPLEQTYTEWKNSEYAKKGTVCQDCHMPPARGRAAKQGPVRAKRFTHTFVGANYRFGNRELAVANLKKSAKLAIELSDKERTPGSILTVRVKVKNVGAGHYLPTGLTELRQMWVELTARDSAGKELFRDTRQYGTVLEDADGKHDGKVAVWDAVKVYSDRRVPPNDTLEERFEFPLDTTSARGYVTVDAKLWYRSLPKHFTDAAGLAPAEPVEMTAASGKVAMRPTWGSVIFGGILGGSIWLPEILAVVIAVLIAIMLVAMWRSRKRKASE